MTKSSIPAWATDVLHCPDVSAVVVDGVVRSVLPGDDPSIAFYRAAGGAHFHERSQVGYAMTTLDTSVYRGYLSEFRPDDLDALIVDVGGGDGRNTLPWLEWGYRRVVVADPAGAALERLRSRIAQRESSWLDRVLLIEADARALPLRPGVARRVFSIEALAYLNEDYGRGLKECARIMADGARLLVADRDYEGALLTRLFYGGGVSGLLDQAGSRDVIDGNGQETVRSRCFIAEELAAEVTATGLRIVETHGISAISLVLGYLRNSGRIHESDEPLLPGVGRLLDRLGRLGTMRRSHVIVAERSLG
jgi:SAM-dependent methyltransferase